jgi:hypothetical protein
VDHTPARLTAEGWVALCKAEDAGCLDSARRLASARADALRTDIRLVPRFLGVDAPPRRFTLLLVSPASH